MASRFGGRVTLGRRWAPPERKEPVQEVPEFAKAAASWEELDKVLGVKVSPMEKNCAKFYQSPRGVRSETTLDDALKAAGWEPVTVDKWMYSKINQDDVGHLLTQFHAPLPIEVLTEENLRKGADDGRFDVVLAFVRSGFDMSCVVNVLFRADFRSAAHVLKRQVLPMATTRTVLFVRDGGTLHLDKETGDSWNDCFQDVDGYHPFSLY